MYYTEMFRFLAFALDVCERALTFHVMTLLDVSLDVALSICEPILTFHVMLLPPAIRRMGEGNTFSLFTFRGGGYTRSQIFGGGFLISDFQGAGGVPGLRFLGGYPVSGPRGGAWSQIFGGIPSLRFSGGYPVSGPGGVPGLRSGGGYLVSIKGKIFDTRFGLIHVQTRKKFFVMGPPP